jgi:hypothetical protein
VAELVHEHHDRQNDQKRQEIGADTGNQVHG